MVVLRPRPALQWTYVVRPQDAFSVTKKTQIITKYLKGIKKKLFNLKRVRMKLACEHIKV